MEAFELRCEGDGRQWRCDARNAAEALAIFGLRLETLFTYHKRAGSGRYVLGTPPQLLQTEGESAAAVVWGTPV
jgi:hypothetical protein